jgi:hypothetical protein
VGVTLPLKFPSGFASSAAASVNTPRSGLRR